MLSLDSGVIYANDLPPCDDQALWDWRIYPHKDVCSIVESAKMNILEKRWDGKQYVGFAAIEEWMVQFKFTNVLTSNLELDAWNTENMVVSGTERETRQRVKGGVPDFFLRWPRARHDVPTVGTTTQLRTSKT